jgi:glycosyltransferase involved in cell wall biosynthesis
VSAIGGTIGDGGAAERAGVAAVAGTLPRVPPLLYFHAIAPPHGGGTPVILHRLLTGLFPPEVIAFTDVRLRSAVRAGGERVLPGEYRYFLRIPPWNRFAIYRWPFGVANALLAVAAGVRAGLTARRRGAGWVLSVADEGFSPIGGAVAARVARVPHLIWVFDLWEENLLTDVDGWIASLAERPIWRGAAAIVCHTDKMADHYRDKHGIECRVVPTPIELPADGLDSDVSATADGPPFEVLSGGAVYWAQDEALGRLARVCAASDDLRLTIVGEERPLRRKGIEADAFEAPLPQADFQRRVRDAHVLFLGLTFDSVAPDIIRTATPARLVDYMASGRPLVVHAPRDSHVATYAREEDFAEVVDAADDAALEAGLRAVVGDRERSTMRARRARRLVVERHDLQRVRDGLRKILEETRT